MIIASLVTAFLVGSLLGRLYSYVALLAVSPLLAFVVAMTAWTMASGGFKAALSGLFAMALSQAGFLVGLAVDPQAGFRKARDNSKTRGMIKGYRSAPKR